MAPSCRPTCTHDQLYLALRLATLDHYVETAEPVPFIVDDILIQFDDDRSRATLEALADFPAKTQVILFTHHERVMEEARGLDNAGSRVSVHVLGQAVAQVDPTEIFRLDLSGAHRPGLEALDSMEQVVPTNIRFSGPSLNPPMPKLSLLP